MKGKDRLKEKNLKYQKKTNERQDFETEKLGKQFRKRNKNVAKYIILKQTYLKGFGNANLQKSQPYRYIHISFTFMSW